MRSTEVAEPGDFAMDSQLPRLGYRGRYPAQTNVVQHFRIISVW